MPHDLYGPSSMGRRLLCAGSARLERGAPEITSKEAEEGTKLHVAVWSSIYDKELDDEQVEVVGKCKRLLESLIEEYKNMPGDGWAKEYAGTTPTVFHEWKIFYDLSGDKP